MNNPHHEELSELLRRDSAALVDEAFVQRCVTSVHRTQRRLLVAKAVVVCAAAAAVLGLLLPLLSDSPAAVSSLFTTTLAELELPWNISTSLSTVSAELARVLEEIDRLVAIVIVLVLVAKQYGPRLFRLGEPRLRD